APSATWALFNSDHGAFASARRVVSMSESEAISEMERGIAQIEASYRQTLESAGDENELRRSNALYVGAQGELTKLMKWMPKVPGDRRKDLGRRVNQLKQAIESLFEERLAALEAEVKRRELEGPFL